MKNKFLFMVCAVSALAHQVVRAEDASVSRSKTNPDIVELRNGLLGVQVDLSRGARVSSFRYKGFNSDDIVFDYQHSNGGLIKDLWTTQGWPGEFDKRKFDAEIVSAGPDEAVLRAWTTVTGDFKNKRNPELEGLILKKTFKLSKGSRVLKVQVEVENVTATSKRFAYWSQNALNFDGSLRKIFFWRPVQHGVDMIGTKRESEYGFWYTAVPRAGWNGVTDPEMERGVVFLMDFNSVEQLYDNPEAFTAEWMYDPVAVPSGKTWKTEIQVVPTEGFAGYSHADQDIIANFKATELPSGLNIQHILAATDRPLRNAPKLAPLVSAIGVSFIFMNIGLFWLGPADRSFPELLPAANLLAGDGLQFTAKDLLVLVVVIPLMVALSLLVKSTRLGKAMRAVSQDPTAAALVGIDVDRVIAFTFFVGGFLGGAASVIYGLYINTISFQMGFQNGLYAFTAAVLGGIGSIPGAVVGGLVIGLVRSLSSAYVGERWTGAIVFVILIVILVFRPEGLLGRGTKEKV